MLSWGANQTAGTFNVAGGKVLQISGINIALLIYNKNQRDAAWQYVYL